MFKKRLFNFGWSLVPEFEVAEEVPEGWQVWDPADLFAGVDGADQGEDEVEDVGVQEVALLPEQHGQHLVAGDLLHLCAGKRVALENADKGLDSGIKALNVTSHGNQTQQHVASPNSLYHLVVESFTFRKYKYLTFETGWGVNTLTPM